MLHIGRNINIINIHPLDIHIVEFDNKYDNMIVHIVKFVYVHAVYVGVICLKHICKFIKTTYLK